jgi:hypothetical protein
MKITPLHSFAAAAAALLAIIVAEWLPSADAPPPRPAVLAPHQAARDAAATPDAPERDVGGWADTIVARPLFTIGRRPPRAKGGASNVAAADLPRLSGIMITPSGRRAIFMPEGGKPLVLAEGATLQDGTIRSIAADSVTVQSTRGDLVLRPSFDRNRVPSPILPTAPMFQPGGGFNPNIPNPAFNPGVPQATNTGDDADDATPAQPVPPPGQSPMQQTIQPMQPAFPGAFRNPGLPRGRE